MASQSSDTESRRNFLKTAGKFAVYTPPALMLMSEANASKMANSNGVVKKKGVKRKKAVKRRAKRKIAKRKVAKRIRDTITKVAMRK